MDKIRVLNIIFLLTYLPESSVYAGSHSLKYYFTVASMPHPGLPPYSIVGHVDDMQFARYTSETRQAQPLYKWMEQRLDAEHWEDMTKRGYHYENFHKQFTRLIHSLFNQTHSQAEDNILQVKFACEMHEDGSIGGYQEFGFNGMEFIVFDKERLVFVPAMNEAQFITQKWNSDQSIAQRQNNRIIHDCINWMKKYFTHGKNELEKKDPPSVKISSRESGNITKIHCQVYGFYPRAVDVKWVKNGVYDVYSEEAKQILPNPDGTFQIRVTAEVTPQVGVSYACHVDHESLDKVLIVKWGKRHMARI
ncbi:major histocompatibility complex class I-related gene protein-like isoform 2-T2 [Discoglossus pictus]